MPSAGALDSGLPISNCSFGRPILLSSLPDHFGFDLFAAMPSSTAAYEQECSGTLFASQHACDPVTARSHAVRSLQERKSSWSDGSNHIEVFSEGS